MGLLVDCSFRPVFCDGMIGGNGGVGGRCFGGGSVQERGIFWDIFGIELNERSFGDRGIHTGGEGVRIKGGGYEGGPPFDGCDEPTIGGERKGGGCDGGEIPLDGGRLGFNDEGG